MVTEEQVDDFFDSIIDPKSLDEKEYVEWLTRRVKRGDADAMYELGIVYYDAKKGVKQDLNKAEKLVNMAADLGHPMAIFILGRTNYDNRRTSR